MLKYKNQLVTSRAEKPLLTAQTNNNNEELFTQTKFVYRIVRFASYVTSETIPFKDVVRTSSKNFKKKYVFATTK
jgi:hypothetical protein